MSNSPYVKDVLESAFEREVLERSREVPVVVDFWAPWCGPCRFLGPILEQEIAALGGRVELAKIDVDRAFGLSRQFGIRGIPAVKAFRNGEVVAQFEGARDARFVRTWLAALVPSEARQRLDACLASLNPGDAKVEGTLAALLDDAEVGSRAALALAELKLERGALDEAETILKRIAPNAPEAERASVLARRVALARDAAAYGGEQKARSALSANENDLEARWALACSLATRGEWRGALEEFLEIVTRNRKFRDDGARLAMLTLFEHLGPKNELVPEMRRRLQVVL